MCTWVWVFFKYDGKGDMMTAYKTQYSAERKKKTLESNSAALRNLNLYVT